MGVVTWIDLGSDGGTGWSPSPSSRSTPWTGRWSRTPWLSSSSAHVWGSRRGLSLRQDIVLLSRALKRVAWGLLMESQRELQRALSAKQKNFTLVMVVLTRKPAYFAGRQLSVFKFWAMMKMLFLLRFSAVVIGGSGDLKEVRSYVQSAKFVPGSPLTSIQGRKMYALLFLKRLCLIRNQNLGGSPDQKPPCW